MLNLTFIKPSSNERIWCRLEFVEQSLHIFGEKLLFILGLDQVCFFFPSICVMLKFILYLNPGGVVCCCVNILLTFHVSLGEFNFYFHLGLLWFICHTRIDTCDTINPIVSSFISKALFLYEQDGVSGEACSCC